MQDLLRELGIEGRLVTTDALNCQKGPSKVIAEKQGEYLLNAKDNQPALKQAIEKNVQDKSLRKTMGTVCRKEKDRDRLETRTAFAASDIGRLQGRRAWADMV